MPATEGGATDGSEPLHITDDPGGIYRLAEKFDAEAAWAARLHAAVAPATDQALAAADAIDPVEAMDLIAAAGHVRTGLAGLPPDACTQVAAALRRYAGAVISAQRESGDADAAEARGRRRRRDRCGTTVERQCRRATKTAAARRLLAERRI